MNVESPKDPVLVVILTLITHHGASGPLIHALLQTEALLRQIPGYLRHDMLQCCEMPDRFLLQIEVRKDLFGETKLWDTPFYAEYRRLSDGAVLPYPPLWTYASVSKRG